MAEEIGVRQRNLANGEIKTDEKHNFSDRDKIQRDVNLQRIRDKAMSLKADMLENVDNNLQDLLDQFVHEVERIEQLSNNNAFRTKDKKSNVELPEKEFIARRSILSELLEISHIRTIYHIFVAVLIVFSVNTIVFDFLDQGRLVLDFDIIVWAFGKFHHVTFLWLCMIFATAILVYVSFQFWGNNRSSDKLVMLDFVWLGLYVVYQIAFLIIPLYVIHVNQLPPASTVVIACEQTRLMMKAHAFVRENIPRALRYHKLKKEDKLTETDIMCPDFSKYLYFLFAPTLVYRDDYPLTNHVNWSYVVSNFGNVLACLFYVYYIFERFCIPAFRDFSERHLTLKVFLLSTFGCMLPGTLMLFIAFFAILHSWLNAFSEMLRFGDRMFYKDWWNSSSFANYYRTWNVVVHDWLYTYIYRDIYKLVGRHNRTIAQAAVFILSAVFHEYIVAVSLGFYYPILFVMFAGAGFGFTFVPNHGAPRSGNVFMWVSLFTGTGLLMCLYCMEWFARQRCPRYTDSFFDYFIPRSWFCDFSAIKS